jgi:hypothetical protein
VVRQEKTAHLDGNCRAGLEGFEPPTHGTGNLNTRKWVFLSPDLSAILVRGGSLSRQLVCQIVCQFCNSTVWVSLRIVLYCALWSICSQAARWGYRTHQSVRLTLLTHLGSS